MFDSVCANIRVEKKPIFFQKKTTHLLFCFFSKKTFFWGFFEKKQDFVLFLRKIEKPYS